MSDPLPSMTRKSEIVATLAKSWGLAIALVAIGAALSFAHPSFLTVPNLINVVRQISINGILAVGVTYVLLTGGVDLSLGSVVALAGVVAASWRIPASIQFVVPVALGVADRRALRRGQRPDGDPRPRRPVHRDARA